MGTDKALLQIGGEVLWRRQWVLLQSLRVEEIFLSARADQQWVPDKAAVLHDEVSGAGPLAGIAAALKRLRSSHLIVLAVDLPEMRRTWFEDLQKECEPGMGAVGCRDGFYEPLAAIYPRELCNQAGSALAEGNYALQCFIREAGAAMRGVEIDEAQLGWFANWNEPENASPD